MTGHDDDRNLQSRLSAADPASALPPTDPERVARLLEAAMADTETRLPTTESRETGTRDRSPLTWLVAAAAVVLIAGAGFFAATQRGGNPAPPAAQATVTRLGVSPATGRCIVATTTLLQAQTVAFRGTVTTLSDGSVTFSVKDWFKGGPTDLAKVVAPAPMMRPLFQFGELKVGGDYVVSAYHGHVSPCLTGPVTGQLGSVYHQAFGG